MLDGSIYVKGYNDQNMFGIPDDIQDITDFTLIPNILGKKLYILFDSIVLIIDDNDNVRIRDIRDEEPDFFPQIPNVKATKMVKSYIDGIYFFGLYMPPKNLN